MVANSDAEHRDQSHGVSTPAAHAVVSACTKDATRAALSAGAEARWRLSLCHRRNRSVDSLKMAAKNAMERSERRANTVEGGVQEGFMLGEVFLAEAKQPKNEGVCRRPLFRTQRDARMSDTDNRQRLGAILARLRAVAASPSAQPGRLPEGDVTASAAQLKPHLGY
eukprot:scaffold6718_cov138-Isochrysis_galbana.AAC.2